MKTEKELAQIACAIAEELSKHGCNAADIFVIIGMLQHDIFYVLDKVNDLKSEAQKVVIK